MPNLDLSQRQKEILALIIKEYTDNAQPLSSSYLAKKFSNRISSATIRNEMLFLEERGFLIKPHISSGRIPSDKGYRYFIDNIMEEKEISRAYQKKLELELLKTRAQNARLERTTAKLLSSMSHCLAISGLVDKKEYYDFGMNNLIESPDFVQLDEFSRLALALDLIDENVDKILEKIQGGQTEIFVGRENPLKEIRNCSMVVSPYLLESGEKGLVAIIGPKRMDYEKNKSLVDFIKKFLSGNKKTAAAILVFLVG